MKTMHDVREVKNVEMNELHGFEVELITYSQEIAPNFPPMTFAELIDSHRTLRQQAKLTHQEFTEQVQRLVDKQLASILNGQYVRWSDLKSMTLAEIAMRIDHESA